MKAEKTSGAKIAPFWDAKAEYARELDAARYSEIERGAMRLNSWGYVIALGPQYASEPDSMAYLGESGGTTPNPYNANANFPNLRTKCPREVLNGQNIRVCAMRGYGRKW